MLQILNKSFRIVVGEVSFLEIHNSCQKAIDKAIANRSFSVAHLFHEEKTMDMHIHDTCEIYYSIQGGKKFLIGERMYDISPGDLFVINPYEPHHLTSIDKRNHERIIIAVHPEFLKNLSTEETDLSYCFFERSRLFSHRISLSKEQQTRFLYFISKINVSDGYGSDIVERAAFMELMVFINEAFIASNKLFSDSTSFHYNQLALKMLNFINQNITERITIEQLANRFYISESYASRIFKAATGVTINKYITARRISIAKSLLSMGMNVLEVSEKSGFNDYSNFLRTFKASVGISPKKYAQNSVR